MVDQAGRDNPSAWIARVNPRRHQDAIFENNCGDCARAFATTVQTDRAVAAAGDVLVGEYDEIWAWTGARPENSLRAEKSENLNDFQIRAYDHIAKQLADCPAGTVAIIGIDFESFKAGGKTFGRTGHWFNAHVAQDGLRFADAQLGVYGNWPPPARMRIVGIESVFRLPGESRWRTA
nr:toxin glutamine deamidase domain-containing protein [Kineosporia babensis]